MKIVNVECWVENLVCRMNRNESMQVNITQCVIVLHCRNCLNTFTPPNFNVKWLFWAPNHISTCCRFRNKSYYWKAQERQNAALCREIFVVWFASWASLWCWERYPHGSLQIFRKYPYNNTHIIGKISDSTFSRCFNALILRDPLQLFNFTVFNAYRW